MEEPQAEPQPGKIEQAPNVLPIGSLVLMLAGGIVFCTLATLMFAELAEAVLENTFITLDDQIILGLRAFAGPYGNAAMFFFTTMGDPVTLGIFVAIATIWLLRVHRWIDAVGLLAATIGGGILNQVLKGIIQRVRPELFPRVVQASGYSFPSGHAMGSMIVYSMLAFVVWRVLRSRLDRSLLLFDTAALVASVGLSRVFFGVHFPTDILGGYIAGAIWVAICMIAIRFAEWYAERRSSMARARRSVLPSGASPRA